MKGLLILVALVLAACSSPSPLPMFSPTDTPVGSDSCHVSGVVYCSLNTDVTQSTIDSTICVGGWTGTIRPPVSYTNPLKFQQMVDEGFASSISDAQSKAGSYEEDHRIPLELGGAPSDPTNLSPEAHPGSSVKDQDENAFKASVCGGHMSLIDAQNSFISKWLSNYPTYKQ